MQTKQITDKLQRPIRDLRISVIDRCNFRCTYCMPEEEYSKHYRFIEKKNWLNFNEITRLVKLFVQCGVSKVRLTGGEPLLRPNIDQLISQLKDINGIEDLALTTNGSLLGAQAQALKAAGLNRLTVSLDTLDSRLFQRISGKRAAVEDVLAGIASAEQAGFSSLKINVVIQKGVNENSILDLVKRFKGTPHVLRFIEYMDVGNCNHWKSKFVFSTQEIVELIGKHWPIKPVEEQYFGEVSKRYQFLDGEGEIGFISSVSQPFCQKCTRVRVSTDGQIFTCLFATKGTDLKNALRTQASDQDLLQIIQNTWTHRDDRYSELRSQESPQKTLVTSPKIEMFQIGG